MEFGCRVLRSFLRSSVTAASHCSRKVCLSFFLPSDCTDPLDFVFLVDMLRLWSFQSCMTKRIPKHRQNWHGKRRLNLCYIHLCFPPYTYDFWRTPNNRRP